ncbi:MAG: XdhC family protein [Bacillota bacterium]|nr:XdhC family protein [Bacillota bacterium]
MKALYPYIRQMIERGETVKSATVTSGEFTGSRMVWQAEKADSETRFSGNAGDGFWEAKRVDLNEISPGCSEVNGTAFFVEIFTKRPRLVILGGGHVAVPVCRLGDMLDFEVVVADDRPEFADPERFKEAGLTVCCDYAELDANIPNTPNTYYVIVTRGHVGDEACAAQLLKRHCPYIGMIGSRTKVETTVKKLADRGFTERDIKRIHAPIGLKIGAQTPAEIAVSIMGEIIQVKSGSQTMTLDADIGKKLEEDDIKGVMVTIIDKKGSSPRGVGSRMLVLQDGNIYGSVGGGAIEYRAVAEAKELSAAKTETYDLSNRESASLGMICGGQVTLLYEPL